MSPSDCIIVKVTLTDCIYIDHNARKILTEKNSIVYSNAINNLDWKGYGFKLENITKIEPIPINGKLSFCDYSEEKNIKYL